MNYTSISQSKKLIELGLSPESADMAYIENPIGEFRPVAYTPKETIVARDARGSDAIIYPCWSVGALLELMPKSIGAYDLTLTTGEREPWYLNYKDWENVGTKEHSSASLIKVVYNMVVWLLENNYIKQ